MVVLKVFDIHENDTKKPLSTFEVGEHVVGRGSFANCLDKKISRRHIVINVKDNEATLTPVHINPTFFMSKNSSHIQILKQNNSVVLSDGDKFGFTIETWYSVKIEENLNNNGNFTRNSASAVPLSTAISSNTIVASVGNAIISQSASCKRNADELYSEERKKLKLHNESLDRLKDNIDKIVSIDHQTNTEDDKESSEVVKNNTTEVFKGRDISDSDDDDSDTDMLAEVTRDTEVVNGPLNNSEENSEAPITEDNKKSSEILDDIKKETMIEDDEKPNIKKEPREEPARDDDNTAETSKAEGFSGSVKSEIIAQTPEDNENTRENNQNPADASTSSSITSVVNRLRREQCWYGQNCYRKNPSHRDQFSHPGDSDHVADSDDDRAQCPYGTQCYRRNPQHRKDYKHPTSRQDPRPSTSNRKNIRRNFDEQNNDDDSDSLEEGDPFSADESSSASEVFEGGDSDSDYMEEPSFDDMDDSEEVKIMFKEAKKFLRKKRQD